MSIEAGRNLRRTREQLRLRYRDVTEASQLISSQHGNPEFIIGLSRLADIENRGTVPSIFRLYSISVIYGLDFQEVMRWYGVDFDLYPRDLGVLKLPSTRPIKYQPPPFAHVEIPVEVSGLLDLKKTTYLSRQIRSWGKLPLSLLKSIAPANQCYALIGTEDWSMHPLIVPGSFVQIDESKKRLGNPVWADDYSRPIYLVEHRSGFRCGWCTERRGLLIVQPHSSSHVAPEVFQFPGDAEIIGQVVAVAMRLDLVKPRRKGSSTTPK